MKVTKINEAWQFWKNEKSFIPLWKHYGKEETVDLPHDAMIYETPTADSRNGGSTGYYNGGTYTYEKRLWLGEERRGKTNLLRFDGVYMMSQVFINGAFAVSKPYGYTPFYVDLDKWADYDAENEIRVVVHNDASINSRWYSGSGIYRNVYLLQGEAEYIVPESIRVKTVSAADAFAEIEISASIKSDRELEIQFAIYNKEGSKVASAITKSDKIKICIDHPILWDEETPYLYTIKAELLDKGVVIDSDSSAFGIRTIAVSPENGLTVNGRTVKLRGACIHHDNGMLGAAAVEAADFRKIKLLKEAGFNAVRMSHHPMSRGMLEACDELGMYVLDEAFDTWNRTKNDYDYGLFFHEHFEDEIEAMVRTDFNHPSVIMYSAGNEIPEISHISGLITLEKICNKIKSLDDSRPTTTCITGPYLMGEHLLDILDDVMKQHGETSSINAEIKELNVNEFIVETNKYMDDMLNHPLTSAQLDKICSRVDVAGYNYMTDRYKTDVVENPDRIILGSETFPPAIGVNWEYVKRHRNIIGDFTWTGFDYLGEAGVGVTASVWGEGGFGAHYPCKLAYVGDLDITGYRRPASYYREIVFGLRKEPYIVVCNPANYGKFQIKTDWTMGDQVSTWTFPGCEGMLTEVDVFTDASEVELFLDGESMGRKVREDDCIIKFEIEYRPGNLEAVAYEKENVSRFILKTAGYAEPVLTKEFSRDGLHFYNIELRDSKGILNTACDREITVEVINGELLAFGSADPKSTLDFHNVKTLTFQGRAQIIVKSEAEPGIKLSSH